MTELAGWDNFYIIVGSAAGALIGLQFVVMTLIADRAPLRAAEAGAAFATPTIVHFVTVLFMSAILCAPWHSFTPVAVVWGLIGLGGITYATWIVRQMRTQSVYTLVFEDWAFHAILPFLAYVTLAFSACAIPSHIQEALFGVGAAALLLLFIGIHNAWDSVTYHILAVSRKTKGE